MLQLFMAGVIEDRLNSEHLNNKYTIKSITFTTTPTTTPTTNVFTVFSPTVTAASLKVHHGDMKDRPRLMSIVAEVRPTEIYNLAAQSHVMVCTQFKIYFLLI